MGKRKNPRKVEEAWRGQQTPWKIYFEGMLVSPQLVFVGLQLYGLFSQ